MEVAQAGGCDTSSTTDRDTPPATPLPAFRDYILYNNYYYYYERKPPRAGHVVARGVLVAV